MYGVRSTHQGFIQRKTDTEYKGETIKWKEKTISKVTEMKGASHETVFLPSFHLFHFFSFPSSVFSLAKVMSNFLVMDKDHSHLHSFFSISFVSVLDWEKQKAQLIVMILIVMEMDTK